MKEPLVLVREGRLDEAEVICRARVAAGSADADTCYALGRIAMKRGDEHAAELELCRAVDADPGHDAARYRLAQVVHALRGADAAASICRDWVRARPGHPVASHLLAAMTGDPERRRASADYVRATFDEMAPDFDRLMDALSYCGPMLVEAGLSRTLGEPAGNLGILDAGCGTGLCAASIRPWARFLLGVDLSEAMIRLARERALHDRLECDDILRVLGANPETFDAIVMADVLVYLGALEDVMHAVRGALRPGGVFVFTAECIDDECAPMTLGPAGRFAHHASYIERAALDAGLHDVLLSDAPLRNENGAPVTAVLGTARR